MTRVLVVEDERPMRTFLSGALSANGYDVIEVSTLAQAERVVAAATPVGAVLLDLGLPDGDGLAFLRRLRSAPSTIPVIVLSARDREDDKVDALDAGADDYLTKPFGTLELLARIRVALRHAAKPDVDEPLIRNGPIEIERVRHEVTVDGMAVHLTPIEFRMLELLARNAGKVITHGQLLQEVWGPRGHEQRHYLRVHVAALRRKIEADPARPRWLVTEQGVGYRLRDE
jgi:two-component system KDP operon response regulator KdpE